ncbi:hypothetical protein BJY04DRAFT_217349 [Aspergillus karnatakaensis]|uniref:uncharacterized protein n=1 Tax=Aspergillus karnatakaensis TaxID=1810916 RepID=UPI003CCDC7F3
MVSVVHNGSGTQIVNGLDIIGEDEEDNVVLVFGCQWLNFTAVDFRNLRTTVLDNPDHHWMLDTLGGLADYYHTAADEKYLPTLRTVQGEEELRELERWFRCDDLTSAEFPLSYAQLAPLLMMTHFVQYAQYLKLTEMARKKKDGEWAGRVVEVLGFCIGFLSGIVVSAANTELKELGSVAMRLAMLLGAVGDVQEAEEKCTGLAVAWKKPSLEHELNGLLEKYPGSYITVRYDENRTTISTPRASMPQLQKALHSAGFSASPVEFNGRYHWAGNEKHLHAFFALCNACPGLQLPDASNLLIDPRSNKTAEPVKSGPLHELVLRTVLTESCQWQQTFAAAYHHHLTIPGARVVEFGPEKCIPPSFLRRLPRRVIHFADNKLPASMSRDRELATRLPTDTDIAIVGMACRVAGADDVLDFWDLLCSGKSQHREMPRERYAHYETPWRAEASRRPWIGNFVNDIDAFDHKFFKKSPREAMSQDPQQRLLFQVAYQALESAGYFSRGLPHKDIGCYVATCTVDYEHNVNCYPASAYAATGLLRSFLAGKLSHYFGWRGPSVCVDTACSGSAVALHHACRAILNGDCRAALVGGANSITSPLAYDNLAGASFLSPTGPCKPFDAKADGYCRGEGFAAIYIKKLSDAIEESDQILATIPGTAVEQNSNCTPIVVPDADSLGSLFKKVIYRSNLHPRDITVVEAHGTGTQVGDPAEYSSVRSALAGPRRASKLALGSVKGLVGHTEGVSGIVALCKVVLMIYHGQIPPQPGFCLLNPNIKPQPDDHIEIAMELEPWQAEFRAALINNYGACGSNASMIITQGPQHKLEPSKTSFLSEVPLPFRLCGLDMSRLQAYASRLRQFLSKQDPVHSTWLPTVSFNTARQSNPNLEYQYIFRAKSIIELNAMLAALEKGDDKYVVRRKKHPRPVILCFGGQVSRFVGLEKSTYHALPLLRLNLDACDDVLAEIGQKSIYPGIFSTSPVLDTVTLQTQLFSLQYACARSWMDCGVHPAAVVGHSFGELVALCISGTLCLRDALTLVVRRATVIRDSWGSDPGAMLAVEGEKERLEHHLEGSLVSIACFNGPQTFTLAGPTLAIKSLQHVLEDDPSIRVRRLDVTNAFHSNLVESLLPAFENITKGLSMNIANIPIERATEFVMKDIPSRYYVAEHLRKPVYFVNAVQRLAVQHGPAIWLEAGSNSTVPSMVRKALDTEAPGHVFLSSNMMSSSALSSLTDTTLGLCREGIPCIYWGHHPVQTKEYARLFLPPYQFEKSRHWMENKPLPGISSLHDEIPTLKGNPPRFSFLGYEYSPREVAKYSINTDHPQYVAAVSGHVAARTAPIAPASLLLDYAVEVLRSLPEGQGMIPTVGDVGSDAPLLMDLTREVWIELSRTDDKRRWDLRFQSEKKGTGTGSRLIHCTAQISMHDPGDMKLHAEFIRYGRLVSHARCIELLEDPDVDDILQGRNVYRSFAEIVDYSKQYQGVERLVGKGLESAGKVVKQYSGESWSDAFLCDSFSQCAGFWVNCMTDRKEGEIYIASGIEQWMRTPLYADMATKRPDIWHVFARHQRSEGWYTSDVFVFTPGGVLVEVFLGLRYTRVAKSLFIRLIGGSISTLKNAKGTENVETSKLRPGDLFNRVRAVVAEFCATELDEIQNDSGLADAGVDSLMAMELARELETTLNCTLPVEMLLEAETFKDLLNAVQVALGMDPAPDTSSNADCNGSSTTGNVRVESSAHIESVTRKSDRANLNLKFDDVLIAFEETKALTDHFLLESKCSGRLHEFTPLLVELCLVLTLEAFQKLGCDILSAPPGQRLGIVRFDVHHRPLVGYLYDRLVEADIVRLDGKDIIRTEKPGPIESSRALLDRIESEYEEYAEASKLTFFTGSKLASVLSGEQDGLQLIFGTTEGQRLVSWIYGNEPHNIAGYKLMGEFMRRLVANVLPSAEKEGATLKILEMGAGTGGGTKWFLPLLAALPIPVEYTFSDISPAFLAQARRKFRDYNFVRYCVHDIEKPPAEELQGQFHIIIASNAVHATSNLQSSAQCIRQALRDDGVLLLLEMTKPVFAIDLVFGLFQGWWVFNDGRTHAITSEQRWEQDLRAVGYGHVDWSDGASTEASIQRVILATAGSRQSQPLKITSQNQTARKDLVERYASKYITGFTAVMSPTQKAHNDSCVLVTGGTGSLGSHLVQCLARLSNVQSVICLNRASNKDGQRRQREALAERNLNISAEEDEKLIVMETDTADHQLGLSDSQRANLLVKVTHIVHNAWPMHGIKPLSSFERQFRVLRNLIDLAADITRAQDRPVRFQFISSIGTVGGGGALEGHTQVEKVMNNGYCEAKFVCERMIEETLQRYPTSFQAMIVRPGQIAGSWETGYWNSAEHFSAMVKSSATLGVFPQLKGRLGWTPVDAAARIITELLLDETVPERVYHVDNYQGQEWADVVGVFSTELGVAIVPFDAWIQRVRQHARSEENPAAIMIDLLESNFSQMSCQGPLDTRVAMKHSKTLQEMQKEGGGKVGEVKVRQFIRSWRERGFLRAGI